MDTSPFSPPLPSVLIVDDEPDICMALGDFLKHAGYAVRTVHAGRDALREVEGGQIGVVILDLGLPDMSGLDVLRGVKKLNSLLPVIVLTASTQETHTVEALHRGAFTYLTKPYNSYELRFALRQIGDAQRLASKVARVEGDLSVSEERFRTVVGTTPDAVVLADRKGTILLWNQAAARLFGYTEHEVIGRPLTLLMPHRYREAHQAGMMRLETTGEARVMGKTVELHGLRKDGTEFPLELSLGIGKTPEGIFYSGTIRDITKRKQSEEAQRQAEARYQSVVENAVEGIFQTTPDGRFLMANPSLAQMLHYDSPEALVSTIKDIGRQLYVDPRKRMEVRALLSQYGLVRAFETELICRDGDVISVSVTARAVRDQQGTVVHYEGTVQDISERKRLAADLLEEIKVAEVTRALGDIGHDVKNMLMPVLSGVDLLREEVQEILGRLAARGEATQVEASRKVSDELIEMIVNNTRRIQDRVRELADAVKGVTTAPEFKPCRVSTCVDDVITSLHRFAAEKSVALYAQGLESLPVIQADERRLFNAFYNVIDNAIPEVPPGGSVTVRGQVDVEANALVISIADTGKGMPPDVRDALFTTQVVSRKVGGTGLGTKIVKDVVSAHKGSITVESEVGVGTTIHIRLPLNSGR
ncbi:MAG: PAS domain S-box protein [Nitrospirota bacterium]|nr:PAS domain S-box protein [Nitrospirota bacterium]